MPIELNLLHEPDQRRWKLVDLLGRARGEIVEAMESGFVIQAQPNTSMWVSVMDAGPHKTLDAAIKEVELRMRAICRRE